MRGRIPRLWESCGEGIEVRLLLLGAELPHRHVEVFDADVEVVLQGACDDGVEVDGNGLAFDVGASVADIEARQGFRFGCGPFWFRCTGGDGDEHAKQRRRHNGEGSAVHRFLRDAIGAARAAVQAGEVYLWAHNYQERMADLLPQRRYIVTQHLRGCGVLEESRGMKKWLQTAASTRFFFLQKQYPPAPQALCDTRPAIAGGSAGSPRPSGFVRQKKSRSPRAPSLYTLRES